MFSVGVVLLEEGVLGHVTRPTLNSILSDLCRNVVLLLHVFDFCEFGRGIWKDLHGLFGKGGDCVKLLTVTVFRLAHGSSGESVSCYLLFTRYVDDCGNEAHESQLEALDSEWPLGNVSRVEEEDKGFVLSFFSPDIVLCG